MGIGRSFQEALHKATQSLEVKRNGLGADGKGYTDYDTIISKLKIASWDRVFVLYDAIQIGIPLTRIHEITKIDMWFLKQYEELYHLEQEISKFSIDSIDAALLLEAKQKGFADRQIAHMLDCLESQVYQKREDLGVKRVYKLVDTCAAEFKSFTPYMYSTYQRNYALNSECEAEPSSRKKIIILGGGPNRIGQGIEFDYCCCQASYSSSSA